MNVSQLHSWRGAVKVTTTQRLFVYQEAKPLQLEAAVTDQQSGAMKLQSKWHATDWMGHVALLAQTVVEAR